MNNVGTVITKVVALTGGAILGALLTRWWDETVKNRAQQRSEYDRQRYAQGLGPLDLPQPPVEKSQEQQGGPQW
jgi:hypothetical protein